MNRPYSVKAAWSICEMTDMIKLVSNSIIFFLHLPNASIWCVGQEISMPDISRFQSRRVFYLNCEEVVITTYYISLLRLYIL